MALFTLMDGCQPPTGEGLANLCGRYQFPTSFVAGPTLFGQGAAMQVRQFGIRSRVAGSGEDTGDGG
jgi:hypothetical protein